MVLGVIYSLSLLSLKSLRYRILNAIGNSANGGYSWRTNTIEKIAQRYHWFGLAEDVKNLV